MIKRATILAVILGLLITVLSPVFSPVAAQSSQITVSNSTVTVDYPLSLNFSCAVNDNVDITDIRLQYQVAQMGYAQVISEGQASFTPAEKVNAEYSLNMVQYGQIPPGIGIDYWWVIKDTSGNKLQTEAERYTMVDNLHNWDSLIEGKVNLIWYEQNEAFGQTIMSTAQAALTKLAEDTGAVPDRTINLSIYTSEKDYFASMTGVSEWSGGVTLMGYNSIIMLVRPNAMDTDLSGIAHELTHVIINQVTFNPYNTTPYWLNEGMAMHIQYSDTQLPSQFENAFIKAVKGNYLISVRSLSSPFSAYSDKAYLSYAESYSIVSYLIDQYGASKMLQFLDTFQQGTTYDNALKVNYGFDMDGLFSQWQVWAVERYGE